MMFSATGSGQGLCIPAQYVLARGRGDMSRLYLENGSKEKVTTAHDSFKCCPEWIPTGAMQLL